MVSGSGVSSRPDCHGAEAHQMLQVEGQQEVDGEQRQIPENKTDQGRGELAILQQGQVEDRLADALLDEDRGDEGGQALPSTASSHGDVQPQVSPNERPERRPAIRSRGDSAQRIEPLGLAGRECQELPRGDQAQHPERHVQIENPAPGQCTP